MNYRTKAEWATLLLEHGRWVNTHDVHVLATLNKHYDVLYDWAFGGAEVEQRDPMAVTWSPVNSKCQFRPDIEYRIKQPEELDMENYSKEFWTKCLSIHPMFLSADISAACTVLNEPINKWLDGVELERTESKRADVWEPVPKTHHRFMAKYGYRIAVPKNVERDVVVFYRDAYTYGAFQVPAGIDVTILVPDATHPNAKTLESLAFKYAGFKLLSITRVVVDADYNLMEYSTKLDNLGRVPF